MSKKDSIENMLNLNSEEQKKIRYMSKKNTLENLLNFNSDSGTLNTRSANISKDKQAIFIKEINTRKNLLRILRHFYRHIPVDTLVQPSGGRRVKVRETKSLGKKTEMKKRRFAVTTFLENDEGQNFNKNQ